MGVGATGCIACMPGCVSGVGAVGATLREAVDEAYRQTAKVSFRGAYYRKDIGARALKAIKGPGGAEYGLPGLC